MKSLKEKLAADAAAPKTTGRQQEVDRIVALPIRDELSPEEVEEISRRELQAHHFDAGFRLFDTQARALVEWDLIKGVFGPIGVGWGKTLITLMIAARAYRDGVERSLLVVPPDVYGQLVNTDIPWARDRVDLSVPFHYLGQKTRVERAYISKSGRRGCYVMPYSCLRTGDSWDLLLAIRPKLVLLDEVHNLKNRGSAQSKRMLHYFDLAAPWVVALSGTVTDKSVEDYQHILKHTLGQNSPLPLINDQTYEWGAILDAEATPSEANAGPIKPLMQWARWNFPKLAFPPTAEGFRRAYKKRLETCPGVVSTGDRDIGVSLVYHVEPVKEPEKSPGWEPLQQLIKNVEDLWVSPSGDEIEYAIHAWAHLVQLNSGFYYRKFWPEAGALAARRKWDVVEAEVMLDVAKEHHKREQKYHKLLRSFLGGEHIPGLDTPMLVGQKMEAFQSGRLGRLPVWQELYDLWVDMKEVDVPGIPERDREATQVCPFKVDAAVRWAAKIAGEDDPGGIIWVSHQEMGAWAHEALTRAGLPSLHCPSDSTKPGSNAAVEDKKNRDKFLVCSIDSHKTGKNLQHHQNMLFLEWPRESADAEQAVGRIHRNGQKADALRVDRLDTTEFDHRNFASCLVDALYHHQTTPSRQKLIYAVHDPLPKLYPSGFLRENGFQNKLLSDRQERDLRERFGVRT